MTLRTFHSVKPPFWRLGGEKPVFLPRLLCIKGLRHFQAPHTCLQQGEAPTALLALPVLKLKPGMQARGISGSLDGFGHLRAPKTLPRVTGTGLRKGCLGGATPIFQGKIFHRERVRLEWWGPPPRSSACFGAHLQEEPCSCHKNQVCS